MSDWSETEFELSCGPTNKRSKIALAFRTDSRSKTRRAFGENISAEQNVRQQDSRSSLTVLTTPVEGIKITVYPLTCQSRDFHLQRWVEA